MRTHSMLGTLLLGALMTVASPRPAAAGGNFHFSFGLPLPFPVFAAPVVIAPQVAPCPMYAPYPYYGYYGAPVYAPPAVAFGYGSGGYGYARPPGHYRPGSYGPPYGNAYGHRVHGYRFR